MALAFQARALSRSSSVQATNSKHYVTQHHSTSLASVRVSSTFPKRSRPLSQRLKFSEDETSHLVDGAFLDGMDFYEILGVSPAASPSDIRSAYRRMVRLYHPDHTEDPEATELCVLLNDIYKVLQDEEQRSLYDAIAGFSASSINPFNDTSFPADQVFVDECSCIGCGKCVRACPATFRIEESLYGRARVIQQGADTDDDIQVAIEVCPVDCIHWVSAAQLPLLEAALARMGRVDAFLMMRNARAVGCVFEEAYRAWWKRRSALEQRKAAGRSGSTGWTFWGVASGYTDSRGSDRHGGDVGGAAGGRYSDSGSGEGRRIAGLAAAAARAARLWQRHQREHAPVALLGE